MSEKPSSLQARADRAMEDWKTTSAARKFVAAEERQRREDAGWQRKRRAHVDDGVTTPLPPTKPKKVSRQVTAVERGAKHLLTPVEYYFLVDDQLVYLGGTSRLQRIGVGRAATDPACNGEDERRAEEVWAAAVLYLDLYAVYGELKAAATTRAQADELLARWPHVDQRPVVDEMRALGASWEQMRDALRALPPALPPTELLRVIGLAETVGNGAHVLAADIATLDADDEEREMLTGYSGQVRDLPEKIRRRFLHRREQQFYVRRIPALPRQRGGKTEQPFGTALADVLFARHSFSRRFSHTANPPHRAVDIADDAQLRTLYSSGPQLAALTAAGTMLDRSPSTVRGLVRKAKVLGLVPREYQTSI